MNIIGKLGLAFLAFTVLGGTTITDASAATSPTPWELKHPRRDQVIDRLGNQNGRIKVERKEGELTAAQASRLHSQDRAIFKQEQFDAKLGGGHITKAEQKALNQEENAVSKKIGP